MLKVNRFVDQSDEGAVTIEVLSMKELGIDSEADLDALCELIDGIEAYVRARQEA